MKKVNNYNFSDAVVLTGGIGSRLGAITKKTPKPLIKIGRKLFLDYILLNISRYGFKKIYLLCCYQHQKFFKIYNKKIINGCQIICVNEKTPRGTGGGLLLLKRKISNFFLLLNGDTYFDINYFDLFLELKKNRNALGIVALAQKNGSRFLSMDTNSQKILKNSKKNSNFINSGIYIFNKKILKFIDRKIFSLENELFPKLLNKKKLLGKKYFNKKIKFIDIGIKKDLKIAKKLIPNLQKKPAFFLDRDGVINHDFGYVHKIKDFKWRGNIIKCIKYLNDKGYYIFVVSNQSGIGRGYYKEEQVIQLHDWVQRVLKNFGAHIDKFYYAPYFSGNKKYCKKDKLLRKPNLGMIKMALKNWPIDMSKSFMVGDAKIDELLSKKAKIKFIKIKPQTNLLNILKNKL